MAGSLGHPPYKFPNMLQTKCPPQVSHPLQKKTTHIQQTLPTANPTTVCGLLIQVKHTSTIPVQQQVISTMVYGYFIQAKRQTSTGPFQQHLWFQWFLAGLPQANNTHPQYPSNNTSNSTMFCGWLSQAIGSKTHASVSRCWLKNHV